MTIRVGDFYSINLNEYAKASVSVPVALLAAARCYMNIMRVDKAIAQCINIEYGNSFDNPFQIEKHCNYIFLVDYLSDDEYHREKIILTQSELKSITGKVSEKEFMQLTRDKKLKELGI